MERIEGHNFSERARLWSSQGPGLVCVAAGGDARGPAAIRRNFGVSTGLNRKLLPERHYE
jgi:hypothetical protein